MSEGMHPVTGDEPDPGIADVLPAPHRVCSLPSDRVDLYDHRTLYDRRDLRDSRIGP